MRMIKPAVVMIAVLCSGAAVAQSGGPSGRGSVTGDPAASSATPSSSPTIGSAAQSNPSGSGTSSSGGKDANGDQGLDKMPDSDKSVMPLDQQHKPPNGR